MLVAGFTIKRRPMEEYIRNFGRNFLINDLRSEANLRFGVWCLVLSVWRLVVDGNFIRDARFELKHSLLHV